VLRRADGEVHQIDARGPLLGFFPDIELADVRFRLAPGDALLLYTDGVTEARRQLSAPEAVRPLFGEDALAGALAGTHGLDAAATISRLSQLVTPATGPATIRPCSPSAPRPAPPQAAVCPYVTGRLLQGEESAEAPSSRPG
jgi:hypothetical protein